MTFDGSTIAKEPTLLAFVFSPHVNLGYFPPPQVPDPLAPFAAASLSTMPQPWSGRVELTKKSFWC